MAGMGLTYRWPVAGSAPTAGHRYSMVQVDVACGAGATDDDTDIIHNFNLNPATGADGRPAVSYFFTVCGAGAALTIGPKFVFKDKDTITVQAINKGANCNWTARVTMLLPHSIIR